MDLINSLFPKARAEILRLLFSDSSQSLYLRDIVRLSGLAVGTIQQELSNMRQADLLTERRDGNRLYFQANTQNPIFPELQGIAKKTTGLVPRLKAALESIDGIQLAFIYGSYAQGSEKSDSDIDLMIIGNVGLRTLSPKLRPVSETVNREINPHVYSAESFSEKLKSKDVYIMNVTNNLKRWIIGSEDEFAELAEKRLASIS